MRTKYTALELHVLSFLALTEGQSVKTLAIVSGTRVESTRRALIRLVERGAARLTMVETTIDTRRYNKFRGEYSPMQRKVIEAHYWLMKP